MRDDINRKQCKTIQQGFAHMLRSAEWEGKLSAAMMDNVKEYSRAAFYNGAAYTLNLIIDSQTLEEVDRRIHTLTFEIEDEAQKAMKK